MNLSCEFGLTWYSSILSVRGSNRNLFFFKLHDLQNHYRPNLKNTEWKINQVDLFYLFINILEMFDTLRGMEKL